jgi:carbon-monoxide dehydrogenase medium subunit
MRAAKRGEALPERLVSTSRIAALRRVENGATLTVGAGVTHAELAVTAGERRLHGLRDAAAKSANPAIRGIATVGGNLCAAGFPAADLVPALLAAGAAVIVASDGAAEQPIDGLLARRPAPAPLVTGVRVPGWFNASAHARLTLRAAGDYPVAIVSVAMSASADRVVEDVRVAVGSLEPAATRWTALEAELKGTPVDAGVAHAAARDLCAELAAREGVEAPAWYRRAVVPSLVRQAIQTVSEDLAREPR